MGNAQLIDTMHREARDLVFNMIDLQKPIISAINGAAVGAGLAVALMADISIASEDAKITDGHVKIGVAAGDHACLLWPLLCGMAKAKFLLMTGDAITGKEAERIGLVSKCVPQAQVLESALELANRLALGSSQAIRFTKRSLNLWMRRDAFEASLALEMLGFVSEAQEGVRAFKAKQNPNFIGSKL